MMNHRTTQLNAILPLHSFHSNHTIFAILSNDSGDDCRFFHDQTILRNSGEKTQIPVPAPTPAQPPATTAKGKEVASASSSSLKSMPPPPSAPSTTAAAKSSTAGSTARTPGPALGLSGKLGVAIKASGGTSSGGDGAKDSATATATPISFENIPPPLPPASLPGVLL